MDLTIHFFKIFMYVVFWKDVILSETEIFEKIRRVDLYFDKTRYLHSQ